jgi:hypothetical protein
MGTHPRRALALGALLYVPVGAQWEESEPGCTAVGECAPCTVTQKDEWFCVPTGFSQELTCAGAHALNTTKTVSCSVGNDGVGSFLMFELLMVITFVVSFICTNRRKARLMNLQHHRIAQYLHT